jgi:HlyD family secretion protein
VSGGVASGIAQSAPRGGVSQGVSGGMSGGVGQGVSGGVKGSASGDIPTVGRDTIWTDTVKRGPMVRQVRGLGKLVRAEDSSNLAAKISLPVIMTVEVRPNQSATVDTRMGLVKGHVIGINAGSDGDARTVFIALDSALPERADVDLSVDATIDIEKLEKVLYVGRPVHGAANTSMSLFKIAKNGLEAQRVGVKLGRSSVNTIEVLDGLKEGDKIILSDMSEWDSVDRIHLK